MIDLVLKLLPESSGDTQTARVLLYKLFYDQTDQGLTLFLLNLFRSFNMHKQPKRFLYNHFFHCCMHYVLYLEFILVGFCFDLFCFIAVDR